MHGPREVLNELKWREDALAEATVWIVHRGAPGDAKAIRGEDVVGLHSWYLELRDEPEPATIPYHRVFRIERAGRVVWERGDRREA